MGPFQGNIGITKAFSQLEMCAQFCSIDAP